MATVSERMLGKRTVFYMKNEALVGRITRHRIQTLASVLGVASIVKIDLEDCHDADVRYRVMGDVLDAWCNQKTLKGVDSNKLSHALELARLSYHAQTIRSMNGTGSGAIKAPVSSSHESSSPSSAVYNRDPLWSSQGSPPPRATSTPFFFHSPSSTNSQSHLERRSDGGTEEGSDSTSDILRGSSNNTQLDEEDEEDYPEEAIQQGEHIEARLHTMSSPTRSPKKAKSLPKSPAKSPPKSPAKSPSKALLKSPSKTSLQSPTKSPKKSPKKSRFSYDGRVNRKAGGGKNGTSNGTEPAASTKLPDLPVLPDEVSSLLSSHRNSSGSGSGISERLKVPAITTTAATSSSSSTNRTKQFTEDLLDDLDLPAPSKVGSPTKSPSKSPLKRRTSRIRKARLEAEEALERSRTTRRKSSDETDYNGTSKLLRDRPRKGGGRPQRPKSPVGARSPVKEPYIPGSPQKRRKNLSKDDTDAGGGAGNVEREKRVVSYSKYGTWRELQKLSKANMKTLPEEEDTLKEDIEMFLKDLDYLKSDSERTPTREAIFKKIRSDRYLNSLCGREKDYLKAAVHAMASFGTAEPVSFHSRTQVVTWYTLERMRRFWVASNEPLPSAQDVIKHKDTMDFLRSVSKLCFYISTTEQIVATGVIYNDRRLKRVYLEFKQWGVRILRRHLENLGIAELQDRGPFLTETGNFIEVHFIDSLLIDYLGALYCHMANETVAEFSKVKMVVSLPLLCGLAASHNQDQPKDQKIVGQVLDALAKGSKPGRSPKDYIDCLSGVWLESPQTFLNCVYEARLKNIDFYPPPGDKHLIMALSRLYMHELLPLGYYLNHVDRAAVALEGLVMQECCLDDTGLRLLGRNVFDIRKVQLTGNYFTHKGIFELTRTLKGNEDYRIRTLDLSDSNIDDEALSKLVPILHYLEELNLSDNFLTWYGIRKITQPAKKTRRLRRLEMNRCHLNEHAFYELMPLIIKTDTVIMEGNAFTPLELKIFARQVREADEAKKLRLDTLCLNGCGLDDECLHEIAKFASRVPNFQLQQNSFSATGIRAMVKQARRHEFGRMKSLALKGCKLNEDSLAEMAELVAQLESVVLSFNNFGGGVGVKSLVDELSSGEPKTKFIDLRHCRLLDGNKKLLSEVARKHKIEIKTW